MFDRRQGDLVIRRTLGLEFGNRFPEGLDDALVSALEQFRWDTNLEPVDVARCGVGVGLALEIRRSSRRVVVVGAGDHVEQGCRVFDRVREGADLL